MRDLLKNKNFLFLILLFIPVMFLNIFFFNFGEFVLTSPDEETSYFFSEKLISDGSFIWESENNQIFNTLLFRPRGVASLHDGGFSAVTSVLFVYFFVFGLITNNLIFVLIIFQIITLIYLFKLINLFTNSFRLSLIGTLLFSIFPPFLLFSNTLMDIIPAQSFLVASLYYYLSFLRKSDNNNLNMFFSILFFIVAVIIRPNFIFLSIFYLFSLFYLIKKIKFKETLFFTILFLILLFVYIFPNLIYYDSFFATGRNFQKIGPVENTEILQSIDFDLYNLWEVSKNYVFIYPIFITGILGLFYLLFGSRDILDKNLTYSFFIFTPLLLLFFSSNPLSNNALNESVRGSLSRYFMIIFIFLIIFTMYFLKRAHFNKYTYLFLIFFFINSLFTIALENDGFNLVYTRSESLKSMNDFIQNNFDSKKTVFIVSSLSYVVPPEYERILYYNQNTAKLRDNIPKLYPLTKDRDILSLIHRLNREGYVVVVFEGINVNYFKGKLVESVELDEIQHPFYKVRLR